MNCSLEALFGSTYSLLLAPIRRVFAPMREVALGRVLRDSARHFPCVVVSEVIKSEEADFQKEKRNRKVGLPAETPSFHMFTVEGLRAYPFGLRMAM